MWGRGWGSLIEGGTRLGQAWYFWGFGVAGGLGWCWMWHGFLFGSWCVGSAAFLRVGF